MSIRLKTIIITSVTLAVLTTLLFGAAQIILLDGFEQLETQNTRRNVQRVVNTIKNELTSLSATNADWAHWDDTYFFVQGDNETYVDDNLTNESVANLSLNLMVFVDAAGDTFLIKSIDLESWEDTPVPDGFEAYLQPGSPLVDHPDTTSNPTGIVLLPEGPMLVSSRPILNSQIEGPIAGSLIFGRWLNDIKIADLSKTLELLLTPHRYDEPQLPDDFRTAASLLSADDTTTVVQSISAETIAGYALLDDINGNPALLLRVDAPRDILAQGKASISFFTVSLIVISVAGGVVTLALLERVVLSRLARLSAEVGAISTSGDISNRVSANGRDELASLGTKINEMLNALELSQVARQKIDERLRAVVNSAPIVLWAIDTDRKFTLLDGSGLRALEVEPGAVVGKTVAEQGQKMPVTEGDCERSLAGEEVLSMATVGDLTFATHYTPFTDQNHKVIGVIGVATNITERVLAEEALGDANQELEQKNRMLERAHELIRSSVETLSDASMRGAGTDELTSLVAFMRSQIDQLNETRNRTEH